MTASPLDYVDFLVDQARAAGAQAADASWSSEQSTSASVRMGKLENVERSETRSVALRAIVGRSQAAAATSTLTREGLTALAQRVVAMARAAPEDRYCGLPEEIGTAEGLDRLALCDPDGPPDGWLEDVSRAAEEAALAVPGVSNSSGSGATHAVSQWAYAGTHGAREQVRTSSFSLGLSVLAMGKNGGMERDYEGHQALWRQDLKAPDLIGRICGQETAARVDPRKLESMSAPVLFDQRSARGLMSAFLGAISGNSVARGTSFLREYLGKPVFGPQVTITDDPTRVRGFGSHVMDGEGSPVARRVIVDQGVLTTWLMNAAAARQLGLATTGHASSGHGGPPGIAPSNIWIAAGAQSPQELARAAGPCLLVRETFSPSVNATTGDYSVGIAGFWLEGGERAYPVSEVTVAGNLKDMFAHMMPASDLVFDHAMDVPSLLIASMRIAGT